MNGHASQGIIRLATEKDSAAVRDIYAPFCSSTAVSFEVEPPTVEEMSQRISRTLERLPWLVCDSAGAVLGFAYASPHRDRAAYRWSADVTVYVADKARRSGVGRQLYSTLFAALVSLGYYNAYAGITLPNPASVGLHESLGFAPVGVYRKVGYKLGCWHDVGWWHRPLQPPIPEPAEPRLLRER